MCVYYDYTLRSTELQFNSARWLLKLEFNRDKEKQVRKQH